MSTVTAEAGLFPVFGSNSTIPAKSSPDIVIDLRERLSDARRNSADYDVAVVGLGYVGLPTALALADSGVTVVGIDASDERLQVIREQAADLLPRDRERLAAELGGTTFVTTADIRHVARARVVLICVPTPIDEHLMPDLTMLRTACEQVLDHAVAGQTLILTSTTYVGCTRDLLVQPLRERGFTPGVDIHVAFSPERIDPGNQVHAQQDVPRIVGGLTQACTEAAVAVLGGAASNLHLVTSPESAEMTKLLENTFRAVNIALTNEFADACRTLDLDVMEVIGGASTKPYGFMPFYPGPGVGGHCIPCDPHYLLWQLRQHRLQTPVIASAMAGIAARPNAVVLRAREVLDDAGRSLKAARVLVLGVAYKADVQDVRESPALEILAGLRAAGANVSYHDPLIPSLRLPDGLTMTSLPDPRLVHVDLVIVHTRHRDLDVSWLGEGHRVLDTTYRLADVANRYVP